MFQQIVIKPDFSNEFKNEVSNYVMWIFFITSVIRLLSWFSNINDLSIYTSHETFMIITGFPIMSIFLYFNIKECKDFKYRKKHFQNVLIINDIMISSSYLNNLKDCDTYINWEDISKISIGKYKQDISKFYVHHSFVYAYNLTIELRDSSTINIPYCIDDFTDVTGEKLYKLMNKYFYELIKTNNILLELEK